MDYIKRLFSCCCSKASPTLKVNFQSTCCKSKSVSIILTNENDIDRIISLLDDIQKVQRIRDLQQTHELGKQIKS